jgi:hypothetical protein
MKKETYTKLFLKQLGKSIDEASVKNYYSQWWKNTREKEVGGLRLTELGLNTVKEIGLETYTIPYPADMELTTNVVIFLDQYINSPYYIDGKSITVTDERKAVELSLFAGDLRRYGLVKAMTRAKKEDSDEENS